MQIFIDFDGTITQSDTITTLVEGVASLTSRRGLYERVWTSIVEAWLDDVRAYTAEHPYPKNETQLDLVSKKGDFEKAVLEWMEGQRAVEEASVGRVQDCEIFARATAQKLEEAGRRAIADKDVLIRTGFHQFVKGLISKDVKPIILSVNWSCQWIRGCIGPELPLDIVSNTIDPSTGRITSVNGEKPILTAKDKYEALVPRLEKSDEPFIYIGDSPTDLECMLKSKHGIVMTDVGHRRSQLLGILLDLGYNVPFVGDEGASRARFAKASSFAEIPTELLDAWFADS